MYWEEKSAPEQPVTADTMVDVIFSMACRLLPQDHAHALATAVTAILPWLAEDPRCGVHTVHVAESGNGWQRPDDLLYPSRRTKLMLRVTRERIEDSKILCGQCLNINGHELRVMDLVDTRAMSTLTTLFSRYIVSPDAQDESAFLDDIARTLNSLGIKPRKLLCGRAQTLGTDRQPLTTRSLMVAELEVEEALLLQQHGLGSHRFMGCGLFIPHKSIHKVGADKDPV